MSQELTVRQLVSKPFGIPAYWEEDILSSDCKSTPGRPLELEQLTLVCDRRITGLTYTEVNQPEYRKSRLKQNDVFYRGVLTIGDIKWLTDHGKAVLEKELQDRDVRARRKRRGGDVQPSNLRLSSAFKSKAKPKVWIQGIKSLPAVFMIRNQRITEGLYMMTETGREFDVTSLSPETAARSQLYFARFRFLRELDKLLEIGEPEEEGMGANAKPHTYRTPNWFISLYIQHVFSGEHPDTAKANLRQLFARHCEWMIKYQETIIHKHRRTIDVPSWRQWFRQWNSGTLRDESMSAGEQPPVEARADEDDVDMNRADTDEADEEASPPPMKMGTKRITMSRSRSRKRPRINLDSSRETSSEPPQPPARDDDDDGESSGLEYVDPHDFLPPQAELPGPQYYHHPTPDQEEGPLLDSDFESPSDSESDADSNDSFVAPAIKTDPDVLDVIPAAISRQPRLPSPGDSWYCPIEGCSHEIDMYHLPDDVSVISDNERAWVNRLLWSWDDDDIISIFMDLVSAHYADHLHEWGVERVEEHGQHYFRWTHPEDHPSKRAKSSQDIDDIVLLAANLQVDRGSQ